MISRPSHTTDPLPRGTAPTGAPERRICARLGCGGWVPEDRRSDADYCSDYCENRAWREAHPPIHKATDEQLALELEKRDGPLKLETIARSKRRSLSERYLAWRALNPQVYKLFRRFAYEALESGQKFGAKAIAERMRWEMRVKARDDFKVNNSFVSRMVRELIEEDERFEGYFQTRKLLAR
jgi:hypothetical protein